MATTAPTRQRWMTVADVVAETQYHPETIREMLRNGELRGFKRSRTWRVRPEDLDKWARERSNRR